MLCSATTVSHHVGGVTVLVVRLLRRADISGNGGAAATAQAHGFRVMEPRHLVKHVFKTDFPQAFHGKRPQKLQVVVRGTENNAWTVAPSFVHAADMTDADYVLFLEKDFMIPDDVRA